jgi:hypothetical protein
MPPKQQLNKISDKLFDKLPKPCHPEKFYSLFAIQNQ